MDHCNRTGDLGSYWRNPLARSRCSDEFPSGGLDFLILLVAGWI